MESFYCYYYFYLRYIIVDMQFEVGHTMDVLQMDTHRYLNEFICLCQKYHNDILNMPPRFDVMIVTVTFPG